MPEDAAFILPGKVPCYGRIHRIKFFKGLFNLFFIIRDEGIFFRINKAAIEEKIPQFIHVDFIADIQIFIICLMKQGQQAHMVVWVHIQKSNTAFDHMGIVINYVDFPVYHLCFAF